MSRNFPCTKDCPERYPGCHDHCDKYKTARAKYDERMAKERLDRHIDNYQNGMVRKIKDYKAKSRKSRKGVTKLPG